ncbi:MAG: tetratricopeptide repeat protein [Chloroflexi bacterium]|nr:tetratricopeptide repeat protein [Chloroflexota bacterium]
MARWGLGILVFVLLALLFLRLRQNARAGEERSELHALERVLAQQSAVRKSAQAETIEQLKAYVTQHPSDTISRWKLANAYQKIRQIANALPQLQAIAKLQPTSQTAQMALGNTYLALQRTRDAEATYRSMTRQWPKDADVWQGLAAALYHQRRFSEALEAAQQATDLEPNSSNEYILSTSAVQAAAQFPDPGVRARQIIMSRNTLIHLSQTMPTNASVFYNLGLASAALHDPKGLDYMQRAYALAPGREDITAQLATAYKEAGKRDQALKVVEMGIRRFPKSAPLYSMLGQLLQFRGGPGADTKALAAFTQAARLNPTDSFVLSDLGVALLRTNHLSQARDVFLKSVRLNRFVAFPYQQLAAIFTRMGDTPRATAAATLARQMVFNEQQLNRVQQLIGHDPNNWHLHLILADRYQEMNLLGPARDEYIVTQRLDRRNTQAAAGLAAVDRKIMSSKPKA